MVERLKYIAGFFLAPKAGPVPHLKGALNYLLVCVIIIFLFWLSLSAISVTFNFSFLDFYGKRIWDGFVLTIQLSASSLIISLILGALVAAGQSTRILPLRYLCDVYVKIIRGTPLIVQIYLFFYIIGTAWGIDNRFIAGVFILSIFEGAYIAEIIRGGYLSLDSTQLEAACSVGFTKKQTLRYVVLPQMITRTLPALTGQFANVIKDSSLLSIIAVIEMTQALREISATTFQLFECYLLLGALYLCLTLPITFASRLFEKRFNYALKT
ncbi:MAG: amino acid ABC transporter permease [Coriobacteriales bacterium]|jgi:polar amino acid transport system permease protein|nr:amino acid ABC transporter permease [Coriobacteriales bacterium]